MKSTSQNVEYVSIDISRKHGNLFGITASRITEKTYYQNWAGRNRKKRKKCFKRKQMPTFNSSLSPLFSVPLSTVPTITVPLPVIAVREATGMTRAAS